MAETSGAKKPAAAAAAAGPADRISALPDAVLEHILGFLPADHAVRTTVLAQRWRHLWKSMRRIRITDLDPGKYTAFRNFMDGILLFRDPSVALDEVEVRAFLSYDGEGGWRTCVSIWIQHLLFCQAKALTVTGNVTLGGPLFSQHLRRLELCNVILKENSLDFTRCPALEDIRMNWCILYTTRIVSPSVKNLSITGKMLCIQRGRISAPSLVSLRFFYMLGHAPLLEKMPSLETALYTIGPQDYCDKGATWKACGPCLNCCSDNDLNAGDILGCLSNATKLELKITAWGTLILGRRCPTFSRLKTLQLDVPVQAKVLRSLICILERSPVLEKLTLQLSKAFKWTEESEGISHPMDPLPSISELLHTVEIKCTEVDERVCFISKFLGGLFNHININLDDAP